MITLDEAGSGIRQPVAKQCMAGAKAASLRGQSPTGWLWALCRFVPVARGR